MNQQPNQQPKQAPQYGSQPNDKNAANKPNKGQNNLREPETAQRGGSKNTDE